MKKQMITAAMMLLLGGALYAASTYYTYMPVPENGNQEEPVFASEVMPVPRSASVPEEDVPETILLPDEDAPSLSELNLAHSFPEGADETDPQQSHAGEILKNMMETDVRWMNQVYRYAAMSPEELAAQSGGAFSDPSAGHIREFTDIRMQVTDGNGSPISLYSNVQEIMSMANIYMYFQDSQDPDAFFSYCRRLWEASHSYSVSMSEIYYCDGCLGEEEAKTLEELVREEEEAMAAGQPEGAREDAPEGQETTLAETDTVSPVITAGVGATVAAAGSGEEAETAETATGSDASQASPSDADQDGEEICPGHMDLIVHMKIRGLSEANGLFQADSAGNDPAGICEGGWPGWNQYTKASARLLAEQDWLDRYGLSRAVLSQYDPLSKSEVDYYMEKLPEGLSDTRKAMVRFALESVGKIPYYWGGKPSQPGYDGNRFGVLTGADYKGRVLKGLDCSGWVSWVYWSATGSRLPHESTSGLALCGTAVSREELQPGDILVRTGSDAHAVMFLGWEENGQFSCIHESSAGINNVTISTKDPGDFQYYRSLVGE